MDSMIINALLLGGAFVLQMYVLNKGLSAIEDFKEAVKEEAL